MIEIIPALKKMQNSTLYPNDFYLNFTESLSLHERSCILWFYHILGAHNPIILLSIYSIALFFFILGLHKIFKFFIDSELLSLLGVLIILFPVRYFSIGENELFYAMPVSAIYSKTLCLWALIFRLRNQSRIAYSLLIPATWFHILAGVQFFLLLFIAELFLNSQWERIKKIIPSLFIYVIATFPYLIWILLSRKSPHGHDTSFMDIIEFRIGHHFFIQYSSLTSIILLSILYICAIFIWKAQSKLLYYLSLAQISILVLYLVMVGFFRLEPALQIQWLKTTIWIELIGILAILRFLNQYKVFHLTRMSNHLISIILIAMIPVLSNFKKKESSSILKEEIQLASWCQKNTAIEALFVYPPFFTRFKSISERSSWVDFKAISHQKAYLVPWYDRIQRIYNINLEDRRNKIDLPTKANFNYSNISNETLVYLLREQSVDYIILPTRVEPSGLIQSVYSTDSYTIYKKIL